MRTKLNWLVNEALPGSLVLQSWLTQHQIGYSLSQRYVASGWLKKISSGVYYRPSNNNDIIDWSNVLSALTLQLNLPIHIAGLTSLAHQGLSHYLQLDEQSVWLGIKNKQKLPKWFYNFSELKWEFSPNHKLELLEKDLSEIKIEGTTFKISRPELAAYEVVDAIGKFISFEHAAELFQGLTNLSPRRVQSLLERSSSVQTNRVFLFLSHYHAHQWVHRLDETNIYLGKGKRQVVPNGYYDHKYKITVPKLLSMSNRETN